MKIALVHDYIKEFGGAERVLKVLTEIYPDAPIYTAFFTKNSTAFEHFKDKKIIASWAQNIPFFDKLASPLRFLTPLIWGSLDLSKYDIVISSASWYITKGFGTHHAVHPSGTSNAVHPGVVKPIEICYCHTPPRWLYGYTTSINFKKYALVKIYAAVVGHFLRMYDYTQAQKVNVFIANSQEVANRIKKFYRRDAEVIYPPVFLPEVGYREESALVDKRDYYFIVSRIVGGKGLEIAVEAAVKAGVKLKIAGSSAGYYFEQEKLIKKSKGKVEFLGQVTDNELVKLYKGAKAFLALAKDEDFGITPVEAMLCGTPVIAFNGGGYKETVIQGKTGVLFNDYSVNGLISAIKEFEKIQIKSEDCIKQAERFSKDRFIKKIKEEISKIKEGI